MVRTFFSLVLLAFGIPSFAQQHDLISAAGGFMETNSFSTSWSLGELATESLNNNKYTLNQGFQQSDLTLVSVTEPNPTITEGIDLFPNPTSGVIQLNLNKEYFTIQNMPDRFSIFNILGEKMSEGLIKELQTRLDLSTFSGGLYYLRLLNSSSNNQTTVIIQKTN